MDNKDRAKEICSTLTLKEKIGQITYMIRGFSSYQKQGGEIVFTDELREIAEQYGVGAVSAFLRGDP